MQVLNFGGCSEVLSARGFCSCGMRCEALNVLLIMLFHFLGVVWGGVHLMQPMFVACGRRCAFDAADVRVV